MTLSIVHLTNLNIFFDGAAHGQSCDAAIPELLAPGHQWSLCHTHTHNRTALCLEHRGEHSVAIRRKLLAISAWKGVRKVANCAQTKSYILNYYFS